MLVFDGCPLYVTIHVLPSQYVLHYECVYYFSVSSIHGGHQWHKWRLAGKVMYVVGTSCPPTNVNMCDDTCLSHLCTHLLLWWVIARPHWICVYLYSMCFAGDSWQLLQLNLPFSAAADIKYHRANISTNHLLQTGSDVTVTSCRIHHDDDVITTANSPDVTSAAADQPAISAPRLIWSSTLYTVNVCRCVLFKLW